MPVNDRRAPTPRDRVAPARFGPAADQRQPRTSTTQCGEANGKARQKKHDKERIEMAYPFLSDEWVSEARKIREENEGQGAAIPHQMKMNLVITEVPFGEGAIDAHMDSTEGSLKLDLGHVEPADLKVSLDYVTAKAILIEGNPQAGMQAFMAGKIRVEGDMAKLMALQTMPPDEKAQNVAKRLREITE
jgi:putative sterol carrier protein